MQANPILYDEDNPQDLTAMSYTLAILPGTLESRYPELLEYFTVFEIIKMIDVYLYEYTNSPLSMPIFINKQAYKSAEKLFPGLLKEHFHRIINTFIIMYMAYRIIVELGCAEDEDKCEDVVWQVVSEGSSHMGFDDEFMDMDILRIKHVEEYK